MKFAPHRDPLLGRHKWVGGATMDATEEVIGHPGWAAWKRAPLL